MLYRERLTPPAIWWLLLLVLAGACAVAVGFYAGAVWGIGVVVLALAAGGALLGSASTLLTVTDSEFTVGRGVLELAYVSDCLTLDSAATSRRSGPEADARAHLVLRPYIRTAVELAVDDAVDPVPYWLVSTRHPNRLAAAVRLGLEHQTPA